MNSLNENNSLLNNNDKLNSHKFYFFPKLRSPTVPKWRQPKYGYASIYDDNEDSPTTISSPYINYNDNFNNSFFGAVINLLNYLIGFAILSLPYALHQSGWIGLLFLIVIGLLYTYTAILLTKCQMKQSLISQSYPDIIELAYGNLGRITVSIVFYFQILFDISLYHHLLNISFAYLFNKSQLIINIITCTLLILIINISIHKITIRLFTLSGSFTSLCIWLSITVIYIKELTNYVDKDNYFIKGNYTYKKSIIKEKQEYMNNDIKNKIGNEEEITFNPYPYYNPHAYPVPYNPINDYNPYFESDYKLYRDKYINKKDRYNKKYKISIIPPYSLQVNSNSNIKSNSDNIIDKYINVNIKEIYSNSHKSNKLLKNIVSHSSPSKYKYKITTIYLIYIHIHI